MQYGDEQGKIFVGGLSWDTTHASMLKYFSRYGEVIDCVVMKNPQTGKSRGFGFVTFKDPSCVETVLANGPHILDGRQIDPKACNPRSMNKSGKGGENSKKKVFVGGLPANCTESQLKEHFNKYGTVTDVVIMYDQEKQRSRGFGFLTFETEDSVDRVVEDHFVQINGKQVECKRAEPRDLKAIADCASTSMMMTPTVNSALGLIQGQFAGSALSVPAHVQAATGSMPPGYMFPQGWGQQPGLRLLAPTVSPLGGLTLLVPGAGMQGCGYPGSGLGLSQAGSAVTYNGYAQPDPSTSIGAAYALPVPSPNHSQGYGTFSQAGTPSPLGTGDSTQADKSAAAAAAYAQLNQLNAAQIGIMGSYPGEASNYGPARAFAAGETAPGTTSGAHISFSPSVTYSLAQGSCVPALQGGYGLAANGTFANGTFANGTFANGAFAGGSLVAGTFGGQGDAPQTGYFAAPTISYSRFPNHAQATAGFHPYRR